MTKDQGRLMETAKVIPGQDEENQPDLKDVMQRQQLLQHQELNIDMQRLIIQKQEQELRHEAKKQEQELRFKEQELQLRRSNRSRNYDMRRRSRSKDFTPRNRNFNLKRRNRYTQIFLHERRESRDIQLASFYARRP